MLKEQGAKPFPFQVFINSQQELYVQYDYQSQGKIMNFTLT
ncbi:hypothetical protein PULV_b0266 [Pseudoalteromonas ulvae UL12]|nr:hypothetical protein [Pseudoalteromonas ulvae UL12]